MFEHFWHTLTNTKPRMLWMSWNLSLTVFWFTLLLSPLCPPLSYWCAPPCRVPLHYQVWLTAILLPRLLCHLSCSAMPAGWLHSTTACGDNNLHWSDPSAYPAVTNGNRLSCGSAIDCPTLVCVCVCVCVWQGLGLCLLLLKCSRAVCICRFIFCCYTS